MTVITGDLILVTDRPSAVTEVWIRAGEIRTHDGGLVLEDRDREPIHDGWLEINVLPGPAILTLVSHGTVRKAIPIVVPNAEATSLEDAVNAARLAQPSLKTWLEELAASILAGNKGPKGDRGPEGKQGPAGPAPYIQNGTWWTGGVDTGIDATGPQGEPGIAPHIQGETWWVGEVDTGVLARGPKGDPGPTGTLDLIDESVQTTIDTVAIPAIEGARDEALGQVGGAVDVAIGTRLDAKADVSTVSDLAAVTTGFTGVARRNSRRIRELVSDLAGKADKATVDAALATKADQAGVDAALATKADTDTVDELSALVVGALGVGRRNTDRIRKVMAALATKSDKADVADLSALATSAVGMGKRNAARIRQLVAALAGKADQSALIAGLATKADTRTLDARIPAGGHSGQLLMATRTGGRWSWADRHPTQYHDIY